MTPHIERRLQKLESSAPPPPPTEEGKIVTSVKFFLVCATAYYLGDPTTGGSPAQAYVRALGYPASCDLQTAMEDPDLQARVSLANTRLLEKFGVSMKHEWKEILDAFKRMHAGFPERYKAMCRLEFD
jgi:hypothetical protein